MRHLFHTKYGASNLICDYDAAKLMAPTGPAASDLCEEVSAIQYKQIPWPRVLRLYLFLYKTWHLGDCNIRAVWKDWVSASWVKLQTLQHALVSHDGVDDVDKVGAPPLSYLGLQHAKCWISLATVGPPPRHGARPNSVGRREVALLGGNSDTTKEIRRRRGREEEKRLCEIPSLHIVHATVFLCGKHYLTAN